MYFANKMGVLEYNGLEWRLYTLNNQTDVRSLMKSDRDKRIYVGGVNELGYLEPAPDGQMKYHYISENIPPDKLNFGNIWNIEELNQNIYFCADQTIIKWSGDQYTEIPAPDKIDYSNIINGALYIGTHSGIYILAGNVFYRLPGLEVLKNMKIRGIFPFKNQVLIATALDGLFLFDGQKITVFQTEANAFIRKNELFSVSITPRYIAIGTVLNGVILTDYSGKITGYYNESHGLLNNTVLSTYSDKDDNLWLGLDNGIAYIALNEPVKNLYTHPNSYGAGYAATLYNGKLYLGTNRGLYSVDWPVPLIETAPVLSLSGHMRGQVWSLQVTESGMICCLDKGMFVLEENTFRSLLPGRGVWKCAITAQDSNKAIVSTYSGFYLMERKNNRWQVPVPIGNFFNSIINFEESPSGRIFARNGINEILRVTFNDSKTSVTEVIPIPAQQNSYVRKINNQIKLCNLSGIYTCKDDREFVPDEPLNSILDVNENLSFNNITDAGGNNIWAIGPDIVGVYYPNTKHFFTHQHHIPLISNFEQIYVLNDLSTIICNENGFAMWSVNSGSNRSENAQMQIIRVDITKPADSIIYMSSSRKPGPAISIAYKYNSLRFNYHLMDYSNKGNVLSRCRMDQEPWNDYSASQSREYSGIKPGTHVFRVETKSMMGVIHSDEFYFEILPPWYRTTWAYILYTLLAVALLFALWYWDNRRIGRKEKEMAEEQRKVMQRKEAEFKKEQEKKEQEIIHLKNEQLEMEVMHKNQELANNAINLARKNEVLADLRADINKLSDDISDKKDPAALRRMLLRLIGKIEENTLHDDSLKKFEEHFDLVHNNFMMRLSEKYPELTLNERKMCALVKMHLSSKEIAPLLNISIRGTETLRYRLRKKLGLNPDESLTSFLNGF